MAYIGTKPANQVIDSTLIADGTVTPSDLSTGRPYWDTSGNLGIGTSSPARNVTLTSSGNTTLQVTNSTSGSASSDGFIVQQNGLNTFLLNQESGALHLGTSNIERISIDSSGRVTTPYQPAFHVQQSATVSGASTVIPWDTVVTNIGSNFNSSNGRFTAPVAGMYHFMASVLFININTNGPGILIYKNGSFVAYGSPGRLGASAGGGSYGFGGYASAGLQLNLYMNASDYVTIVVENAGTSTIHSNNNWNNFSGFLIG